MKSFLQKVHILGIIFALAAGLTTFVGLKYLEAPLQREQERRVQSEIEHIVGEISATLAQREKTLNLAASFLSMEGDAAKIYQFLSGILQQNPDYLAIYLGTPDNALTYLEGWTAPEDFDVRSRPWYRKAVREGRLVYTEPYLDAVEDRWVITLANPIYAPSGELVGVVGLDTSLEEMVTFLRGQSFIFSDLGELIVTSANLDEVAISSVCSMVDCSLLEGQTQGTSPAQLGSSQGIFHWRTLRDSGFIVATFVPESDIFNSKLRTELIFETVFFSFVIGLLVLLVFLRAHIVRPMRALEEDILAISLDDDVTYRLPVERHDSLGSLRESLNIVLQQVQERYEQILDQREELSAAYSQLVVHEQELQSQFQQIKQQEEQIRQLAEVDALTGLYNRRKFQEDLSELLAAGGAGAVFMLDIDDFQYINDTQGHSYGDRVLWSIARFLEQKLPEEAVAYRFGGDEFLIIISRKIDSEKIRPYVDDISKMLDVLLPIKGHHNRITCSMGVVLYPSDGTTVDELLIKADIALHHAKRAGKNRHQFFEWDMAATFTERMQLEELLVEAVQTEAFELVYQPIVETQTGEIAYFEALLRLQGKELSPREFIPIAEELELTPSLGRWVITTVLEQMVGWRQAGKSLKPIAVNLSPKQFFDRELIVFLQEQLAEKQIECRLLELEITEAVFVDCPEDALKVMSELKALGVKLALDDYGTGYSSIDYLTKMHADRLKLHESLTEKFWDYRPVMEGLIAIAHGLGLSVVAEGVERLEEARFLRRVDCDYLQGYLFSKPVAPDQVLELLDANYHHLLGRTKKES